MRKPSLLRIQFIVLAFVAATACHVKFVSDYDDKLDSAVTDVHTSISDFLTRMAEDSGTPAGTYAKNKGFYSETLATLASIRMRAEANNDQNRNSRTIEQIQGLEKTIGQLKQVHASNGAAGLSPAFIEPARSSIDTQCKAITTFELAKKRGKEE